MLAEVPVICRLEMSPHYFQHTPFSTEVKVRAFTSCELARFGLNLAPCKFNGPDQRPHVQIPLQGKDGDFLYFPANAAVGRRRYGCAVKQRIDAVFGKVLRHTGQLGELLPKHFWVINQ